MEEIYERYYNSIDIERAKVTRCLTTIDKLVKLMYKEMKELNEKEDSQEKDQEVQ